MKIHNTCKRLSQNGKINNKLSCLNSSLKTQISLEAFKSPPTCIKIYILK